MSTQPSASQHIVTVRAGETLVLKKTARILTVATFGGATLEAPCFDVSNQEAFACYVLKGFTARPNNSSATINGEEQYARGIYIADQYYPFSKDYMIDNGENHEMISELNTLAPFKDILKNVCYSEYSDSARGSVFYYTFLTIPSLGDQMKVFVQARGVNTHGAIDLFYPVLSLQHIQGDDQDNTALCGCASPATTD